MCSSQLSYLAISISASSYKFIAIRISTCYNKITLLFTNVKNFFNILKISYKYYLLKNIFILSDSLYKPSEQPYLKPDSCGGFNPAMNLSSKDSFADTPYICTCKSFFCKVYCLYRYSSYDKWKIKYILQNRHVLFHHIHTVSR